MSRESQESLKYDCFRGCLVTQDAESGATECSYRVGCCKLGSRNWLQAAMDGTYPKLYEVRFKNTRKGFYINDSPQNVRIGDLVMVEATTGMDLGIVTLEGPAVGRQMKCKGVDPENTVFKKIYRKARQADIERWQEAIAREQDTMIKARRIAAMMGLEMKIGDVEFQGDGTKAIFYYIADGRVDFRQLIKAYAEEFRIRIEMKQIGARQEAGLIGGLGVCGRELCCSNYISSFQSISTSAARCQDLSLNPLKLAGQCGKLKCCLNYEVPTYLDALSRIPKVNGPIQLEDGEAYLFKTDILSETLYFTYDKGSGANLFPVSAEEVSEILELNARGEKAPSLMPHGSQAARPAPEFISAVGEGNINRFDKPKRNGKGNRGGKHQQKSAAAPRGEGEQRREQRGPRRNGAGRRPQSRKEGNGGEKAK